MKTSREKGGGRDPREQRTKKMGDIVENSGIVHKANSRVLSGETKEGRKTRGKKGFQGTSYD